MSVKEIVVDSKTIRVPFPASTAIAIGDLLYLASGVAHKASEQADQLSESANQLTFKGLFLGVAMNQRLASETNTTPSSDQPVITDGVFDITTPAHTWVIGEFCAASEQANGTQLENQQVEYVAASTNAIGICVQNSAANATMGRFRLISTLIPNKL